HEGMGGAMQEGMHGGMHGGMPGGMGPHMMHRMLEVMQATPAQRAQVKAILEQAHADIHAMRASSRGARGKMRALFEQPTIDAQAAEALREQMAAEHDRIGKRMLQARIAVADVFTPAQRQTLVTRMKAYHALLERQRAEREAFEMRKP
ncbi:MAG: periplasmic heavy metal sensor, partial [Burkholderiales bacterium]|nr:periplasmic heavy metal sensor [Burkholderiales bacterium]